VTSPKSYHKNPTKSTASVYYQHMSKAHSS